MARRPPTCSVITSIAHRVRRTTRRRRPSTLSLLAPGVNEYSDQSFAFGEEYVYVVRAVSLGTGGGPVESLNSNPFSVAPVDVFAPAAPDNITPAVSSPPARISLFFPANRERDVVGYNVFRSTDPALPKEQWTKLNRALAHTHDVSGRVGSAGRQILLLSDRR